VVSMMLRFRALTNIRVWALPVGSVPERSGPLSAFKGIYPIQPPVGPTPAANGETSAFDMVLLPILCVSGKHLTF
jgi:hypothetical protein